MLTKMIEPIFSVNQRVLYGDTDSGGVVYNANYLRYFEIGRSELMREWICSYSEIEELGYILPVTECFTRYKAPAHYDDLITIETSLAELKKVSCRFTYRITRLDSNQTRPKLLAKGYTIHASVNKEGKLAQLPKEIFSKLQRVTETKKCYT
jgi:acyl-CoA thioester hydrolase